LNLWLYLFQDSGSRSRPISQCSEDLPEELPQHTLVESAQDHSFSDHAGHKDTMSSSLESPTDQLENSFSDHHHRLSDADQSLSSESMGEMDQDLYQEIDANHESIYELKTASFQAGPPQIRIDRKLFQVKYFFFIVLVQMFPWTSFCFLVT
jgi:hypothetical protein